MNEKIAVIGGGQMGSQIAAFAAMAGYKTIFMMKIKKIWNIDIILLKKTSKI